MDRKQIEEIIAQSESYDEYSRITAPLFPISFLQNRRMAFVFNPDTMSLGDVADVIEEWLSAPASLRELITKYLMGAYQTYAENETFMPTPQAWLDHIASDREPEWPLHGSKPPETPDDIWSLITFEHVFIKNRNKAYVWGGLGSMAWNTDDQLMMLLKNGRELVDVMMV